MKDELKTKKQLIEELNELRRRIPKRCDRIARTTEEPALREGTLFRALMENILDAICFKDKNGCSIEINQAQANRQS